VTGIAENYALLCTKNFDSKIRPLDSNICSFWRYCANLSSASEVYRDLATGEKSVEAHLWREWHSGKITIMNNE
jgi:hypothetical protein